MPVNRWTMIFALAIAAAVAAIYALTLSPTPEPAPVETAQADAQPAGCDLVDSGELDRLNEVRFTPVHPERHSRIFGIGLTDTLEDACETLLAAGFGVEDTTEVLVPISDIGNPADERAARYSRIVQMGGPVTNPLDGDPAEATVILVASSPATYSSVEYLSASFTHATPITLEAWTEQVTGYLGPPSDFRPGYSPFWVLGGPDVAEGHPADLCDPAIADHSASWWEAVPEIDEQAAISDSVPAHDGRTCTIVVTAEPASADSDPALIGRTRLAFIDYVSVAANRRAENAHVLSLRYPPD